MSNKVEYENVVNFNLKPSDLAVVLKTQFGKMVIIKVGDKGVSVSASWINKDKDNKMSVGIAPTKEYLPYTGNVADEDKILGSVVIEMMKEAGYTDYVFPVQTADEMVKSLFTK